MDLFVEYETAADASAATAGGAAGGDPSGTDPAAAAGVPAPDGAAGTGEPDSPSAGATGNAPVAAPMFDPADPAVADVLDSMLEVRLAPFLQALQAGQPDPAAGQQQQQGGFDPSQLQLDPFDEGFGGSLAQLLAYQQQQTLQAMQAMVGQITQPLNQRIEAETTAEGEQRLADMVADEIARNGDFPRLAGETESKAQGMIRPLAEAMFPELAQRFGAGPRTAEMAISRAAGAMREIVAEVRTAAVEQYKNEIGTLAGAPHEPGVAGAAGQGVGEIRARSIGEGLSAVTARHAAALRGGS